MSGRARYLMQFSQQRHEICKPRGGKFVSQTPNKRRIMKLERKLIHGVSL